MPASALANHRQRLLRAMGVMPYSLRTKAPNEADIGLAAGAVESGDVRCVLVLPDGCGQRQLDVLDRALQAFGPMFTPVLRVSVADGRPKGAVPAASAYLALGEAQAHALGRNLSADVMAAAEVVLLDLPQSLLQAEGKRRLWQALSGLRRQWRRALAG